MSTTCGYLMNENNDEFDEDNDENNDGDDTDNRLSVG